MFSIAAGTLARHVVSLLCRVVPVLAQSFTFVVEFVAACQGGAVALLPAAVSREVLAGHVRF